MNLKYLTVRAPGATSMLNRYALAALLMTGSVHASSLPVVDVYKSPLCGCCTAWTDHLNRNGYTVALHDVDDVPAARARLGMPVRFGSCHVAKVGGYVVEGHVPAKDIKQMLDAHPDAIGLAVPAMPPGSPGMEGLGMEGAGKVAYDTFLIRHGGQAIVFAHH